MLAFTVRVIGTLLLAAIVSGKPGGDETDDSPEEWYSKDGMAELGIEACTFIMSGNECPDFKSENSEIIEAHAEGHGMEVPEKSNTVLCEMVDRFLHNEWQKNKESRVSFDNDIAGVESKEEASELVKSYCSYEFDHGGEGYDIFKKGYVEGKLFKDEV